MVTEWCMFDEAKGYEVRQVENGWELRIAAGDVVYLSDAEFNQLREAGENPKDL